MTTFTCSLPRDPPVPVALTDASRGVGVLVGEGVHQQMIGYLAEDGCFVRLRLIADAARELGLCVGDDNRIVMREAL